MYEWSSTVQSQPSPLKSLLFKWTKVHPLHRNVQCSWTRDPAFVTLNPKSKGYSFASIFSWKGKLEQFLCVLFPQEKISLSVSLPSRVWFPQLACSHLAFSTSTLTAVFLYQLLQLCPFRSSHKPTH